MSDEQRFLNAIAHKEEQTIFNDAITNAWFAIEALGKHPTFQKIINAGLLDEPETALTDTFGMLEQLQQAFDKLEE